MITTLFAAAVRASRRQGARPRAAVLFASVTLACMLVVACGGRRSPINVLIIGVDSLRPDHLGCYGYGRPTSAALDALAARGVLFESALSQASWTTPSFGTVFTSLYPSQHGALTVSDMLSRGVPTLAEILAERGYATCGIANAPALSSDYGFDRGFQFYDVAEPETRDAEATTRDALKWLDAAGRRPFFLFVHYFDVHLPYAPKPPYDTLFDPDYAGPLGAAFNADAYAGRRGELLARMRGWSSDDWNHVRALYDGEIAFTDKAIKALLEGLGERGLGGATLIVVLGDHGQEFFEHGAYGHGHSLYGEVLRVPLVMALEGRLPRGRRVKEQVRLLDVAPTILDILGVDGRPGLEGASLLPLARGSLPAGNPQAVLPPEVAFAEGVRLGGEKKAITAGGLKVIHDAESGETAVFDLKSDPGESRDLGTSDRRELRAAARALFEAVFSMSRTWHIEIGAEGAEGAQGTEDADGAEGAEGADGGAGSAGPEGAAHTYSLRVIPKRGMREGSIELARLLTADGDYRPAPGLPAGAGPASSLSIKHTSSAGKLVLAFKTAPANFPVTFDFKVDGASAQAITYLGESLTRPDAMPFVQVPAREACRARGEPSGRPAAPYIVLWLSGKPTADAAPAALSDKTLGQLRALGYVQ